MWRIPRQSAPRKAWQTRHASSRSVRKDQDWLLSKKSVELRQAAVACGTVCSGTKQVIADGLENAISGHDDVVSVANRELSIVSVDMGIRNLAYCHLQTKADGPFSKNVAASIDVRAWRRIDMTGSKISESATNTGVDADMKATRLQVGRGLHKDGAVREADDTKEDFSPAIYAERAHNFITDILQKHQPTHVLIERQRFRSGGGPAVQEWTLRVGMFEFMLYATLHTLAARGEHSAVVVPVQPPMVNRYWLSRSCNILEAKPTSTAMKKYKIDQVGQILKSGSSAGHDLSFMGQAEELKKDFLEKIERRTGRSKNTALPKLDDVSDSLLQGLAWIAWKENRGRLHALRSPVQLVTSDVAGAEGGVFLPWVTE